MKSTLLIFLIVFPIASTYGQGLPPRVFLDFARRGAILTYDVDVTKCEVKLPDTIPAYSFGDVLSDVYIEYASETRWRLFTAVERPVNSSRFNVENGTWRVTELEFTPDGTNVTDGTAAFVITDVEQGADRKVLASGTLSCKISTGAFSVNAQRMGGIDLEREPDVMAAFKRGEELTFAVDLSACVKQGDRRSRPGSPSPLAADAAEYWTSRVSGYRVPGKIQEPAVEFTSILMGPKRREVFSVRVQGENEIQVKTYALSGPGQQPSPVVTYRCSLGTWGSFHVFRV